MINTLIPLAFHAKVIQKSLERPMVFWEFVMEHLHSKSSQWSFGLEQILT